MKRLLASSFLLFILLAGIGVLLSSSKLVWNDEIYTEEAIEESSLWDIARGRTKEGNFCPLFYFPQKLFLDACHYRLPLVWHRESPNFYDLKSQIILRIPNVIYVSLALVLIFFTLTKVYASYRIGFFGLAL